VPAAAAQRRGGPGPPLVLAGSGDAASPATPADTEGFRDRTEGAVPLELLGAPDEAAEAEGLGLLQRLLEQEGLADAGLALQDDHSPLTPRSPFEERNEHVELVTTTDDGIP